MAVAALEVDAFADALADADEDDCEDAPDWSTVALSVSFSGAAPSVRTVPTVPEMLPRPIVPALGDATVDHME